MQAYYHIGLSTALYFYPNKTDFKISGFEVTFNRGYDDCLIDVRLGTIKEDIMTLQNWHKQWKLLNHQRSL